MNSLPPLPGFDWQKINWGGPDQPRTEVCSYCGDSLETTEIPLILWNADGWCAEFCDNCQATHWGLQAVDEPVAPRHEPEVMARLGVRTCRVCGCTDARACPGGCYWVSDDLCSACAEPEALQVGRAHGDFAPGFWANETSGRLRPVIMRYLQGETLMIADVMILRAYFRQWINAPGFIGPEIDRLRAGVDILVDRATIEAWLEDAMAAGVDPL